MPANENAAPPPRWLRCDAGGLLVELNGRWVFAEAGLADLHMAAAVTCPLDAALPTDLQPVFGPSDPWRERRVDQGQSVCNVEPAPL